MRKLFTILVAVLLTATVWAQAPQKMSYQAVIRNSSNTLVVSTQIGMEINIRQGSPTGTVVYTEIKTPITNANGLVSIEIGGGVGFSIINWGASTYFIETKTAVVAPLTTYTITGVSQLLSVPYALNAKTAENGITTVQTTKLTGIADGAEVNVQADWNQIIKTADDYIKNKPTIPVAATHYLGEEYLGGIIFYLYTDNTGTQKGLIVSKTESTATWSGSTSVFADRTEDGAYNMNGMPTGEGTARTWVETLGAGWYLPSIDELSILWHNRYHVNKTARAVSSTLLPIGGLYWSSTENIGADAYCFNFRFGQTDVGDKTITYRVRAVRAF